jgi:hypothetical protein
MQVTSGPVDATPYASASQLDAICANPSCATQVLLDSDDDFYFVPTLVGEPIAAPAIILMWRCPSCGTENSIEEWTLEEARTPNWPTPLSNEQADLFPQSMLISTSARRAALARYEAGR